MIDTGAVECLRRQIFHKRTQVEAGEDFQAGPMNKTYHECVLFISALEDEFERQLDAKKEAAELNVALAKQKEADNGS